MIRTVSVEDRRRGLVSRHRLAGDADGPEEVTAALVALHATDPASVYLSVLARSATSTLADVAASLYEQRTLVRWMAMRRTLFVFVRADLPVVQAAVGTSVASMLRRQLVARIQRNGTEPAIEDDVAAWIEEVEHSVTVLLRRRGEASGVDLSHDEPRLRHLILPGAPSDRPQRLTSALLTLMSADGAIVRGRPTGAWTSRHHRWEPIQSWWPDGVPGHDPIAARAALARRWLVAYGPATSDDLQWWTGWNKSMTRRALADVRPVEVDLHGEPGIDVAYPESVVDHREDAPVAALLPALDPTPMGWKHRDWFLGVEPARLFDRAGNIGPTIWWNGELIGSWAVSTNGEIRTAIIADRGADARAAVHEAAITLHPRLEGAVVTPAVRTPLERLLAGGIPDDL